MKVPVLSDEEKFFAAMVAGVTFVYDQDKQMIRTEPCAVVWTGKEYLVVVKA